MFEVSEKKDAQMIIKLTRQERQFIEAEAKKEDIPLAQVMRRFMRAGMAALAQAHK